MDVTPGQRVFAPSPDETGARVIATVVSLGDGSDVGSAGEADGTNGGAMATIQYESGAREGATATYHRDQLTPVDPDAPHPHHAGD